MDVDLLYERHPAYCFLYGCFDHIGLGCHHYTKGRIDDSTVPYGLWLQAEVKHDVLMDYEDDQPPYASAALVESLLVSDPPPSRTDMDNSEDMRINLDLDLDSHNTIMDNYISNRESSRVDLLLAIPNLNLCFYFS
ncbi:hypothetical protein D8674_024571 [Pyrus ussuriensis x Pyrus communis]|uniref:Zinc knuckle CX2CX4HX4C domain-containing protein n=1 Tax=Pyrus ussuriensis x Pyrus communis TaxID=2448454 RepID=A0A5N5H394_9ROSA|nr:hypothetical protein D8674_024571 [Pyrus ussuriensis x Pyrus communis]